MKVILNLIGLSECGKTSILSPYSNLGEAESLFVKEESFEKGKMTKWIIYTMHLN